MSKNVISVPISIGELCDKYTILQIKSEKITDLNKLSKIENEIQYLKPLIEQCNVSVDKLNELKNVNEKLWLIEDDIRDKESQSIFSLEFIELARAVYITNDLRFELKTSINELYNSDICEVKSYAKY
jgi:hypothetical protein